MAVVLRRFDLNYGIQRSENGGTSGASRGDAPPACRGWQYLGGGLQLSTSGTFPFQSATLQMPELMQASSLGRPARTINMNRLGEALTEPNAV